MRDFEERYLTRLLERAGGSVAAAARLAEMDRSYLTDLLRRSRITNR
jgi:transcriptional regulator with GAF, ATPase, and Fis domain